MSDEPKLKINKNGDMFWRLKGKLHREDGPAIIYADGDKYWYINGSRHRIDGPAAIQSNEEAWFYNGLLHNESGPARIIYRQGIILSKYWYLNDNLHRIDGPAVEYTDGNKVWCIDGKIYSYEEWFKALTSEQQHNYLWNLDNEST
jgi:hypothetical protein